VAAPPLTTTVIQDPLPSRAWLDDDDARAQIQAAFTAYANQISTPNGDEDDVATWRAFGRSWMD
jgi:hypothetical protein